MGLVAKRSPWQSREGLSLEGHLLKGAGHVPTPYRSCLNKRSDAIPSSPTEEEQLLNAVNVKSPQLGTTQGDNTGSRKAAL